MRAKRKSPPAKAGGQKKAQQSRTFFNNTRNKTQVAVQVAPALPQIKAKNASLQL